MTGDEHYREAERLLEVQTERAAALDHVEMPANVLAVNLAGIQAGSAMALAHATLAQAAATLDAAFVVTPKENGVWTREHYISDARCGNGYGR